MPLPIDGKKLEWPPLPQEVLDKWREWSAWYSGDPRLLTEAYVNRINDGSREGRFWSLDLRQDRANRVHIPIAGDLAELSADLSLSEPPEYRVEEAFHENPTEIALATQRRLTELVALTDLNSRLIEAKESNGAMGSVFLKPIWDTSAANHPLVTVGQVDNSVPEFRYGRLVAVTFWTVVSEDGSRVLRHLERHERGLVYHGLFQGTHQYLGTQIPLASHPATADYEPEIKTGIDDVLAVHMPNKLPNRLWRGSAYGQSLYSGVEGLMDMLDDAVSAWCDDLEAGKARMIVPQEWMRRTPDGELVFDTNQRIFTALDIDPQSAKEVGITPQQFAIRYLEFDSTVKSLLSRIISSAGFSPQSLGLDIEGNADSGTAMEIRERRSFIAKSKQESHMKAAVERLLRLLLLIDKQVFGTPIDPNLTITVKFADSVQPDQEVLSRTALALSQAQAASIKTRIKLVNPTLSPDEVEAEYQAIMQETGAYVPDPTDVAQNGMP